ncbi:hypothetical protein ACRALDRAFT_1073389 [Sodiomyces alcalophilus JCM 7366]|uniref:uncharacterized protein n=1 Tax=Sodiomyces alcalophilus JCM 7366 TaxID=591952 RepID=UPI0039B59AD9
MSESHGLPATRSSGDKRKPLRTYGRKRAHPNSEPSNHPTTTTTEKRRRVSSEDPEPPTPSELPRLPGPASSNNFERRSILHYFRPGRANSTSPSSDPFSDPCKLVSTPPSSPPQSKTVRRSPRRLRLRPPASAVVSTSEDETDPVDDGRWLQFTEPSHTRTVDSEEGDAVDHVRTKRDVRQPRQDLLGTMNEAHERLDGNVSRKGTGEKPKRTKSTPVQTTINLSTKPAFEECKICRIVYNPLHPKDVKYHAKRHKAILRSQSLK